MQLLFLFSERNKYTFLGVQFITTYFVTLSSFLGYYGKLVHKKKKGISKLSFLFWGYFLLGLKKKERKVGTLNKKEDYRDEGFIKISKVQDG